MTESVPNTPELAATVGEHLAKALADPAVTADPAALVALVLDGVNAVRAGDALGTVRRDPATGTFYIRVSDSGVHKWRIVNPQDGSANAFDMRELDYPIVYGDH